MDILQFVSSIAWQIIVLVTLLTMIVFRKGIASFFKDLKSFKISKDGIEFQKKIEQMEVTISSLVQKNELISESIKENRYAIEIIIFWENINKLIWSILKLYGYSTPSDELTKGFELLSDKKILEKSILEKLKNVYDFINNIDLGKNSIDYTQYLSIMTNCNELLKKLDEIYESTNDKVEFLTLEFAPFQNLYENHSKILRKLMNIIKHENIYAYQALAKLNDADIEKDEHFILIKSILIDKNILTDSELFVFTNLREMFNRVWCLDSNAYEKLKQIDIEQENEKIIAILSKLDLYLNKF